MRPFAHALSILCFTVFVHAQTPSAKPAAKKEPPPGPLHTLAVKGNKMYSSEEIIKASGLKLGERLSVAGLEQSRKKLQGLEIFNNVAYGYKFTGGNPPEYNVTFEVSENEQLYPVKFERLGKDPEAIRNYLKSHVELYGERIPGTEGAMHRYTAAVQDFVAQSNPNVKVKASISNDDPAELFVLFRPDAPAPTISQVLVSGNDAVDTGAILRAVNAVAVGVPLSETRLKLILDGAIKPVYEARGYAAVSFPKIEVEPSKNNLGVVVKVEIREGPVFKFGSIRFRGKGLEEDEVKSAINFKPGQTFNAEQMDNFRIDLLHRLKRRGLLDANITNETQVDDPHRAVNVIYNVVPGEAYHFGTLDIQGLDITSQPVITKLWGEKPGQTFNPDYPDFFLKKVQEQGLFDNLANTTSDYTADSSTHNVTVHLYFKGGESEEEQKRKKKQEENPQLPPSPN
jgi:outer membrane protein assembly factor BamA